MKLGAHESIQGGFFNAIERANADNCACLQIFTKAPQMWKATPIKTEQVQQFNAARNEKTIGPVLVHDSYLINPCSAKQANRRKSLDGLIEEANRCDILGAEFLVLHPGSPGNQTEDEATSQVAKCLIEVLKSSKNVELLIETTAGQGKSIGHRFEHIAAIIEKTGSHQRLGVCFDTCHSFAAGYDMTSAEAMEATMNEFDEVIGLEKLKAFHLNDSKKPCGSRVDRHELIGKGELGEEAFRWLLNEPRFKNIPGILETPIAKGETYKAEIEVLKKLQR